MPKAMTIIGTRPELIKMSRVINELDKHIDHTFVHTGQNFDYELNEVFYEDLEIRKPDYYLGVSSESSAGTIGNIIEKSDSILRSVNPDILLLYGDTNSCLSVIPAKRLQIPIIHMEAGNRCYDQRVPEEINRKIVDHLSDINIVLSEHARRNLLQEGIRSDLIFKSGSHLREVLEFYMPKIVSSDILERLGITPRNYFLVSMHREENIESPTKMAELRKILKMLAGRYMVPVICSTHPRLRKKIIGCPDYDSMNNVHFMKPFSFTEYVKLQANARCILSDSGTITEESSLLNLPAITLRDAHERPEGMDSAVLIMTNLKEESIINAVDVTIDHHKTSSPDIGYIRDYHGPRVSKQILKIALSYINLINRSIWYKY